MIKFLFSMFFISFLGINQLLAQDQVLENFHPHHTLGFLIGHVQINQGVQGNGSGKWLSLPSWGINYNYKFSRKWAIGLHNDIVVEDFVVKEHLKSSQGSDLLERSYPIASAVVVSYKPGKHFSYMVGTGAEFAHTGNLFLIRIGAEYNYYISNDWELNVAINNDLKINAYNSWAIGLGVTKVF